MKVSEIVKQNQEFLNELMGLDLKRLREFVDNTRDLPETTPILIEGFDKNQLCYIDLVSDLKYRGHWDLQEYLKALQEDHKEYPEDSDKQDILYIEKDELHPRDLQTYIPVNSIMSNKDNGVIQIITNW